MGVRWGGKAGAPTCCVLAEVRHLSGAPLPCPYDGSMARSILLDPGGLSPGPPAPPAQPLTLRPPVALRCPLPDPLSGVSP